MRLTGNDGGEGNELINLDVERVFKGEVLAWKSESGVRSSAQKVLEATTYHRRGSPSAFTNSGLLRTPKRTNVHLRSFEASIESLTPMPVPRSETARL